MIIVSQKGGDICRKFNPGVWVWYSQRDHHQSLNVKLGRVQIDNQLNNTELSTRVVFSEVESRYSGEIAESTFILVFASFHHVTVTCAHSVGVPFLDLEMSISMHGEDAIREYE